MAYERDADFTPTAPNFKELTYMNMQQLTNFPYIEADFDALTNYELLSLIVKYLNDVITNNNEQNTVVTNLYNAYVSLQNYVNDYFDNLDVQEEINNKLDEMARDGSLYEIIRQYTDPIVAEQNRLINNIQQMVLSSVTSVPIPVSSTSAMTDTNRIYVLTTSGHWYYYNGTAWTDGGVYQSDGVNPDSDELVNMVRGYKGVTHNTVDETTSNLLSLLADRIYLYYLPLEDITNYPTSLNTRTVSDTPNTACFLIYSFTNVYSVNSRVTYLIDLFGRKTYIKYNSGVGQVSDWRIIGEESNALMLNYPVNFVWSSSMTETNTDLNNVTNNKIIAYYLKGNQMQNAPVPSNNTTYYLNVFTYGVNSTFYTQVAVGMLGTDNVFIRYNYNGNWSDWVNLTESVPEDVNNFMQYDYLTSILQEPFNIANKTFTAVGDSITHGDFIGSSNVWIKWLTDKFNTTYNNKAVGGASFGLHSGYGQIIDQITTGTNNQVLFIAGGINDYVLETTKADFTSALEDICTWLESNYNGTVIFITPVNHCRTQYTNEIPLDWYREEITRIALDNGYSVINGKDMGFPTKSGDMATLLYYDGLHPSVDGQKMYANKLYEILK